MKGFVQVTDPIFWVKVLEQVYEMRQARPEREGADQVRGVVGCVVCVSLCVVMCRGVLWWVVVGCGALWCLVVWRT